MATELIGIELNLRGEEGVYEDLVKLDTMIKKIGGRHTVEVELGKTKQRILELRGAITETKEEIDKLKAKLSSLKVLQARAEEGSTAWDALESSIEETNEALKEQKGYLENLKSQLTDATQRQNEYNLALRNVKPLGKVFNDISTRVAHLGSALQSAGNALTRFSAPLRMLLGGAVMGAGYNLLNKATEGLKSGFSRYDTMKKYDRIMKQMGYTADDVTKSINALDESVQGLPTGLDDMVSFAQRFISTTGDIERGTKYAIAANNAFLASMSTDTQKYQGMMQLQDVIGGKDMNAREWQALANSMMPAIRMMGQELGLTGKELDDWIAKVQQGKISNKDFLDAMVKAGTEQGKLVQVAQESKNTWEAFISRIGTAFSRMGYGILLSLDEIVKTVTGGGFDSLNSFLDSKVIPTIDNLTKAAKDWINTHPEEIIDFVNSFKGIDWKGLLTGFGEGLMSVAGGLQKMAQFASGRNLSWLGKFFAKSGMYGWVLTVSGGLLKGTRHLWAGLGTVITAITRHLTAGKGIGLFGMIMKFFGGKNAEKTIKEMPTVTQSLRSAVSGLSGLLKAAGAITIVAGTGAFSFKAVKSMLTDLKEIIDIGSSIDWGVAFGSFTLMAAAIGVMVKGFQALGKAMGKGGLLTEAIGALSTVVVTGTFAADMFLIKTGFNQLRDAISTVNEVIDQINNFGNIKSLSIAKNKAQTAVETLNEIVKVFTGKSGSKADRGKVEAGLPTFTIFQTMSVKNISGAVSALIDVVNELNKLSGMTVNIDGVTEIVDKVSEVASGMWKLLGFGFGNIKGNIEKIADGIYQLRRVVYHINKLGADTVSDNSVKSIKNILSQISKAFDATETGDLRARITALVTSIKEAMAQFEELNQTIEIKTQVRLSSQFQKSVDKTIKEINDARRDINSAWNKIPTTYSKSVTFRLNARVVAKGFTSASNEVRRLAEKVRDSASGGVVYRAEGGSIPLFKRKGTDTVPAMLTPGEYVQNKRAVSMFGLDFMRKVNSLDMRGAMQELMLRAGHMVNGGRNTTINNYYNNNQKVVQHINNPSERFTYKAASRFVGAI